MIKQYVSFKRAVALAAILFWGFMLYSGIKICAGAAEVGLPNLPNSGQIRLYVWTPLIFVVAEIIIFIFGKKVNDILLGLLQILAFLALLPVAMLFGGGV